MVYHSEDVLVASFESMDDCHDEVGASIVAEERVDGVRPRTERPKFAVKLPLEPPYACMCNIGDL